MVSPIQKEVTGILPAGILPNQEPLPQNTSFFNQTFAFVKTVISNVGYLIASAVAEGKSREIPFEAEDKRPVLFEIRLDCHHSITFNESSGQYTLIMPAPPIKNLAIAGGGAKGVILPGAIRAFDEFKTAQGTFREQLQNIAGSSVGAITAALLAAGMSAERFIEVSRNMDFKQLLGTGYGPVLLDGKPIVAFIRTYLKESIGNNLKSYFEVDDLSQITSKKIIDKLASSTSEEPEKILSGILDVLKEVSKAEADNVRITFSMLRSLHRMHPLIFKDLTVTATCRDNGQLCHFNAELTPDLDISIGCRASGSLPLVLLPVRIEKEFLHPGYSTIQNGKQTLSFVDGGYLDNIPVAALDRKQLGKEGRGIFGQNLQTLALVFDTTGRNEAVQSPYHDAKVEKNTFLNPGSFIERVLRDLLPRKIGKINTTKRNTVTAMEGHEKIRTEYTQRSIPLLIQINAVNFKHAKKHEEFYCERGYQQTMEYLKNHENEMLYHTSENLNELLSFLPIDFVNSLDIESLFKHKNI